MTLPTVGSLPTTQTDQRGAVSLTGDVVGRDKNVTHYHLPGPEKGIVGQLLDRLHSEMEQSQKVQHTIETLLHFYKKRSHDGIDGLEAKLKAADRDDEYFYAMERKEQFAKLLEKWSLYASAQEIFAHLLARAEYQFSNFIQPQLGDLTRIEVNQLVDTQIVGPTVNACATSVFALNHGTVMGMFYWLAEQCFVRWHK